MKRFISIVTAVLATLALSLSVQAAEVPFTQAAFDQAVAAGKPVVVDFAADWCPVCRAQKPLLNAILQQPEMAGVTLFVANYDKESDLKQALHVAKQSTQVVFKGGKEVARATGQTQKAALQSLLAQAL